MSAEKQLRKIGWRIIPTSETEEYIKTTKELLSDPEIKEYFKNVKTSKQKDVLTYILDAGANVGVKAGLEEFKKTGDVNQAVAVCRCEARKQTLQLLREKVRKKRPLWPF